MAYDGPERRRYPRFTVVDDVECRLQTRTRVRVIDISQGGALLGADCALPIGTQANLRSGLGNAPFASAVEIRRSGPAAADQGALALGAIFLEMDDQSRRSLRAFLDGAGS